MAAPTPRPRSFSTGDTVIASDPPPRRQRHCWWRRLFSVTTTQSLKGRANEQALKGLLQYELTKRTRMPRRKQPGWCHSAPGPRVFDWAGMVERNEYKSPASGKESTSRAKGGLKTTWNPAYIAQRLPPLLGRDGRICLEVCECHRRASSPPVGTPGSFEYQTSK